jgi:hypothetical protein
MPGHPFYGTGQWKALRRQALIRDGYRCVVCHRSVRAFGASRVDHILERSLRPDLALSLCNVRTLCVDCDAIRHRAKGGGPAIVGCDANGVPLVPGHHWRTDAQPDSGGGVPGGRNRLKRGCPSPPDGGHALASPQVTRRGRSA